jgi:hypothetical protein
MLRLFDLLKRELPDPDVDSVQVGLNAIVRLLAALVMTAGGRRRLMEQIHDRLDAHVDDLRDRRPRPTRQH